MTKRALLMLIVAACGARTVDADKITASPLLPALDRAVRCPDAAACQAACDHDDLRACEDLGGQLAAGAGGPVAPDRAAPLFERACAHGRPTACTALALLYQDGRGVAEDDAKAASLDEQACTAGAGVGCFNLALMIEGGPLPSDPKRAASLMHAAESAYQKQCDGGDLIWCINLGVLYEEGSLGTPDPKRAADVYRHACWGGHAAACVNFALELLEKPASSAFAGRLLEQACRAGSAVGCGALGQALYQGRGLAADPARGVTLLRQGCDAGDGSACGVLGAVLSLGDKIPKDLAAGNDAEERGCAIGSSPACMALGADGLERGVTQLATRGFERACAIGDGEGCWMIANLRQQNLIEPRGEAAAMVKAREACSLRYRAACIVMLARGEQPPVPPEALPGLRAEGCKAGATSLCDAQ